MGTKERIFELADRKFKEQQVFASAIKINASVVSNWRTGKSTSYMKYLNEIAEVLNTTPAYLLNGEEKDPAAVAGDGELDPLAKAFLDVGIDVRKLSDDERAKIVRVARAALDL